MLPNPCDAPILEQRWPAAGTATARSGACVTVINFNTSRQTLRCIESLRSSTVAFDSILVLDNASRPEDFEHLRDGCAALDRSELSLYRSEKNLGFAAGSNYLIDQALTQGDCIFVALLNNDAVAQPNMLEDLLAALLANPKAGMAGGRMHRLLAPQEVDTLGIALYSSLMPADRKTLEDPWIGPTGGCCLMTRALLDTLQRASGYYFDDRYFCYCEDTDLAIRAVLLGFQPAYIDRLVALHEGQASSAGGGHSDFISYHGVRNSIWMQAKLIPTGQLAKHAPLLVAAHAMTCARYILLGKFALLWRIYRDAFGRLPEFWRERNRTRKAWALSGTEFGEKIVPRFYRRGYLAAAFRQMLGLKTARRAQP
ncbi:MAG: glycosyltransferase [Comamonadaceae bacterium]|nr:MAG: glycosyltransferase [Comamonadaceae bacterium]